VTQVELWS